MARTAKPHLSIARRINVSTTSKRLSNRLLKTALWFVWLPIIAVLWVMLLDTSYDWISAPSTTKVIGGLLILILMACVVIGLVIKAVKKLWERRGG